MKTPRNLVVGQEIVIASSGSWDMNYTLGYTVIRVTPTRVTVKKLGVEVPRSFTVGGVEVGHAQDYSPSYISDVTPVQVIAQREERQRKIRASSAIEAVRADCQSTYDKDSMQRMITELEVKLAAARTTVEAI